MQLEEPNRSTKSLSLSSEDKQDKIKDVDLVLIIDNSKTMKDYNKLEYVKNSNFA